MNRRGYTLVEIMIATLLTLVMMAAVVQVFGMIGEGIRNAQFAGPYQPYVVYIASTIPDDPPPAVIFMHGANQNHLVNAVHFNLEGATVPGLAAYDVPAVIVLGLGRDPNWNTGPAEMDLLETSNDAIARLGLDPERIVLSGISAGGIGTFRHLARYPDKWTGGYSIVGSGTTTLENLINVLRATSFLFITGIGMTIILISAGLDLSVGSTLALGSYVTAMALRAGVPVGGAVLIGIAVGAFVGFINGTIIVRMRQREDEGPRMPVASNVIVRVLPAG